MNPVAYPTQWLINAPKMVLHICKNLQIRVERQAKILKLVIHIFIVFHSHLVIIYIYTHIYTHEKTYLSEVLRLEKLTSDLENSNGQILLQRGLGGH